MFNNKNNCSSAKETMSLNAKIGKYCNRRRFNCGKLSSSDNQKSAALNSSSSSPLKRKTSMFNANKALSLKKDDTSASTDLNQVEEDSGFCEDLSNNNLVESPATGSTWCKLAYWEECNRVGPLVTVTKPWIGITNSCCKSSKSSKSRLTQSQSERSPANVAFVKKDGGEELPLVNLFSQNQRASESTKKVRDKIGKGIVLQRVDNEVWLFNIDQIPIFVNSPTLENTTTDGVSQQSRQTPSSPHDTAAPPFTVHKVLPGQTVKAFDFANSASGGGSDGQKDRVRRSNQFGPYDPYAVRVSFGKGWGCNYSRQDATNCPCWLEVLLVAPSPKKPPPVPELVTDAKEAQICDSNKTGGDR